MNPFDLAGPDFLVLYALVAGLGLGLVAWRRRHVGPAGSARAQVTDPYAIAALRGGPGEMIRVAILALVERKLLVNEYATVLTTTASADAVSDPLEQAIVGRCFNRPSAYTLVRDPRVLAALEPRLESLRGDGLIPTVDEHRSAILFGMCTMTALAIFALIKILVAVERGHFNIMFLIMLAVLACGLGYIFATIPILVTPRGRATLRELRRMFTPLVGKWARSNRDESVFLAAVYGPDAVKGSTGRTYRLMFPRAAASTGESCGSSCNAWSTFSSSSSCSASSDSSCSSSSSSSCSSSSGSSCSSSSCGGGSSGCGGCGSSS